MLICPDLHSVSSQVRFFSICNNLRDIQATLNGGIVEEYILYLLIYFW